MTEGNIPKCCCLLIIDVDLFTPMTNTLQTQIHRLHRTLELWALKPSLSRPKPTSWVELSLGDNYWFPANPWYGLLTKWKTKLNLLNKNSMFKTNILYIIWPKWH